MLATAAVHHHHDLITTFQAVVMGVVQGVTELFPISSLGHAVLIPTLFRWHNIVVWQSEKNSPWMAFLVMLHVGWAVGLLIYFWRDWVQIIRAFFRTLAKRRIETPNERLAWLIICATIPVGLIALVSADAVAGRALQTPGGGDLPDGQRLHPALRREVPAACRGPRAGRARGAEPRGRAAICRRSSTARPR